VRVLDDEAVQLIKSTMHAEEFTSEIATQYVISAIKYMLSQHDDFRQTDESEDTNK
jgi:hypothetical protein